MSWTGILLNIILTMVLMWLIAWTLLPWGFGITNFKESHGPLLGFIGSASWIALVMAHISAIVCVWKPFASMKWVFLALIAAHVVFGLLFGRNLSTA
ncbi:hypothetical protein KO489_13070 [Reinekea forsetii]|nr:hypothetical protein [Reinekea forsetii]